MIAAFTLAAVFVGGALVLLGVLLYKLEGEYWAKQPPRRRPEVVVRVRRRPAQGSEVRGGSL